MKVLSFVLCLATLLIPCLTSAGFGPRILIVETMPVDVVVSVSRATVKHLATLGWSDGETADIVLIEAEGNRDLAQKRILTAVAEQKPDLVITLATLASQAAHDIFKNTDVPVLFGIVSDPVGAGIVPAVGSPSHTNITGLISSIFRDVKIDLALRMLGLVHPRPVRLGVVHTSYPSDRGDLAGLQQAAGNNNELLFLTREIPYLDMPRGKEAMLAQVVPQIHELEEQVDCWWILNGPLGECPEFMDLFTRESDKPVLVGNTMDHVRSGALLSVTGNYQAWGAEMAKRAKAILNGTNPGTLPVTPFSEHTIGVNLATALTWGIVVESDILRLAKDNVYR